MDWNAPMFWWLAAGVLVAAELATGTFYLLMLAWAAWPAPWRRMPASAAPARWPPRPLLGAACTAGWHFKRARSPRSAPADRNRDVNIDIGQTLQVDAWTADGTARVPYRGAAWDVALCRRRHCPPPACT